MATETQQTRLTSVFSDKRVFQLDYVPERILHRDDQISKIQCILADLERGVRPRNVLCVGDFGTGKTAVVRSICRGSPAGSLRDGVAALYVNCSEENTQNRIIRSVLRDLGAPVKPGFPTDYYLRTFKELVGQKTSLILILDEVDKLVERKGSEYEELFYTLSRSLTNVVIILLTNRASLETTLLSSLDSRVRDTFRFERVEFGDYDVSELSSILSDRCRIGLKDNAYDPGIVDLIAGIAYKRGLRARGLIDLTRKAAETAEYNGHETITYDDVQKAALESSHDREMEIIRRLPPAHRAILGYILVESPRSKTANEGFRMLAARLGFGQSPVTIHGYINDLETMGLTTKEKRGLGRGKGVEMRLIVPPELVNIVAKSLGVDPPHPISEYVNRGFSGPRGD